MESFDPRLFGARWAARYDEWHEGFADSEGAVAGLAELAGGGAVLEFGVGTGRLALPLAERGLDVVGVDISEEMLAQLRAKPGADKVTTVLDDMTTVSLEPRFTLAFIAFNSIFVLPSQRAQVDLFRNAAAHLLPGGRFVLETVVHLPGQEEKNRLRSMIRTDADELIIQATKFDPVTGFHDGAWVVLTPKGTSFHPLQGRHVTHHEMDLMAELAGLELEDRWGDWERNPFTAESRMHVSIYRKP